MSPLSRSLSSFALVVAVFCVLAASAGATVDEGARHLRIQERAQVPDPPTKGERAAKAALEAVGVPYRWGGTSPSGGFDCSGLVRWAWGRLGVDLPHNSYALYSVGRRVSESNLDPGDILFFSGLGHVGLYIGGGRMVHAPYSGKDVEIVRLANSHYGARLVAARRVS